MNFNEVGITIKNLETINANVINLIKMMENKI